MGPKQIWDVVAAFTGAVGLVAGIAGFVIGAWGYEPYCVAIIQGGGPIPGCTREGGEVFGLFFATSAEAAGFIVACVFAIVAAGAAAFYKWNEAQTKAAAASP